MTTAITYLQNLLKRQEGQTLSEYALILFLVVIVAIVALTLLGNSILNVLNQIAGAL
ncbi:Flp family type IVb pilin [candidate division KSB1 bacterium]|nr:Flp family type IVb pilin [candidate division KSB1 bacterium]